VPLLLDPDVGLRPKAQVMKNMMETIKCKKNVKQLELRILNQE